jgi:hypothetical protein
MLAALNRFGLLRCAVEDSPWSRRLVCATDLCHFPWAFPHRVRAPIQQGKRCPFDSPVVSKEQWQVSRGEALGTLRWPRRNCKNSPSSCQKAPAETNPARTWRCIVCLLPNIFPESHLMGCPMPVVNHCIHSSFRNGVPRLEMFPNSHRGNRKDGTSIESIPVCGYPASQLARPALLD